MNYLYLDIADVKLSDFRWFSWKKHNGKVLVLSGSYYCFVGPAYLEAWRVTFLYNPESCVYSLSSFKQTVVGDHVVDHCDRKFGIYEDGHLFNAFLTKARKKGVIEMFAEMREDQRVVKIRI